MVLSEVNNCHLQARGFMGYFPGGTSGGGGGGGGAGGRGRAGSRTRRRGLTTRGVGAAAETDDDEVCYSLRISVEPDSLFAVFFRCVCVIKQRDVHFLFCFFLAA